MKNRLSLAEEMPDSAAKDARTGEENLFVTSLIAGAMAGTMVDVSLYPLDTLKTRLQSKQGFRNVGGFSGLYKGLGPVLIGSAPTAALFFVTYDGIKMLAERQVHRNYHPIVHITAAAFGEVVSCLIRVPVEVLKQRKQAMLSDESRKSFRFLYRGYCSTVLRDMPFSLIQFVIWEQLKKINGEFLGREVNPAESAACGSVSGAVAAAVTTPVDVAKTRIMLASKSCSSAELTLGYTIRSIYKEGGISNLFSGIGPRVVWITLGGFVFFGVYEQTKLYAVNYFQGKKLANKFS